MEQISTLESKSFTGRWFRRAKPIQVLLIGNNPLQLSNVYSLLQSMKEIRFTLMTAFSLDDSLRRAYKYKPHCILIDDTFNRKNIKTFVRLLGLKKNRKLQNTPVALLKSSNHSDMPSQGIEDFLLKSTLTPDSLSQAILKAIKSRKPYSTFYKTYRYGRRKINRLIG